MEILDAICIVGCGGWESAELLVGRAFAEARRRFAVCGVWRVACGVWRVVS